MHEQKFKDLLSSTCQVSPERIVLNSESEVMKCLGSILTGGNIWYWIFCFYVVKPLMPILALLPMLCVCKNPGPLYKVHVPEYNQFCFYSKLQYF